MAITGRNILERSSRIDWYIRYKLPNVPRNRPDVWQKFLYWSQLPELVALAFVKHDRDARCPIISLTSKPNINGYYNGRKHPRVIWLAEQVVDAYENKVQGSEILVESTILHELVHMGSYISQYSLDAREEFTKEIKINGNIKTRGGYMKDDRGNLVEVGKQFEAAAYGQDIGLKNMSEIYRKLRCGSCI